MTQTDLELQVLDSHRRYHSLFEAMLDGFATHEIICDAQGTPCDYRFLTVNHAFERITGLQADQIVGKTVLEVLPQTEPFWIETYGKVALTREPIQFEHHSAEIKKHFSISAFSPAHGEFACIVRDITTQRQIIEALQESERHYEELARHNRSFAWEIDPEGIYTYVSPLAEPVLGYKPEELIGKLYYYDLAPAEDRTNLRETVRKLQASREPFHNLENRMVTKSGAVIWVETSGVFQYDANGNLNVIHGTDTDITARKMAEAGMARLATAIEQAAESIIITDPDGIIQYVNPAFSTITGFARDEVLGRNPRVLKSGTHDTTLYQSMWQTLGQGHVWRGRLINKRKDGTLYTQDTTISPVRDNQGKLVHFVAVTHDISENLLLQEQLMQAQKMESIGRLAGGVAHDFNNMLMGVIGYAELAREKLPEDHPALADFDVIHQIANRSATLTRQLLTFARKQSIKPRAINLNESIPPMLAMLQRLIGESINLDWQTGENLWQVRLDPVQIDQILANLCVNARDAMHNQNGHIRIATRNVTIDELYCRNKPNAQPGDYVCCSVSDDGCGMSPEILQRIFDPFFTTKEIGQGTGLGLSTVYGILQQNNGFVHVYSEPGRGTTFKLYFPRDISDRAAPAPPADPPLTFQGEDITILLVEDDDSIRTMTIRFLQRMNLTVLAASDAHQAIQLASRHQDNIDILLTDMVMPGMDGRQLADTIRIRYPAIHTIFMSGYSAEIIRAEIAPLENSSFLAKPFTQTELTTALQRARPPHTIA